VVYPPPRFASLQKRPLVGCKRKLSIPGRVALRARDIQIRLAPQVARDGELENVRLVAAADISVRRELAFARGAVVLMSYPEMEVVEMSVVEDEPRFPYVPGLLTFREAPILLRASSGCSDGWPAAGRRAG
jgi:deoxyinosine 3'endonuclease (endonuclease V)